MRQDYTGTLFYVTTSIHYHSDHFRQCGFCH